MDGMYMRLLCAQDTVDSLLEWVTRFVALREAEMLRRVTCPHSPCLYAFDAFYHIPLLLLRILSHWVRFLVLVV